MFYDAMKRKPSTWTREKILVVDPRDEPASGDLLPDLDEELDESEFEPSCQKSGSIQSMNRQGQGTEVNVGINDY